MHSTFTLRPEHKNAQNTRRLNAILCFCRFFLHLLWPHGAKLSWISTKREMEDMTTHHRPHHHQPALVSSLRTILFVCQSDCPNTCACGKKSIISPWIEFKSKWLMIKKIYFILFYFIFILNSHFYCMNTQTWLVIDVTSIGWNLQRQMCSGVYKVIVDQDSDEMKKGKLCTIATS